MNPLVLDIPTIAITGSSGKTTVREMIASILDVKWKVLKNIGNKNLPINTEQIAESYDTSIDVILLELGMGKPGAGERHCGIIQPNVSIITNIGAAHYGNLGNSIESTAKYKSALIKYMKPDGTLLINKDDDHSTLLNTHGFKGRIITVGMKNKADYQASDVQYVKGGMKFRVELDGTKETFYIPAYGFHNILNATFAIAIAHHLKFTIAEIKKGLKNYEVPIKRLNVIELSNHSILIDDTVNANPQSVKAAIDVLKVMGEKRKKFVVLGSMLELGDYTIEGHKEVGEYLANHEIEKIFTYGKGASWIVKGALDAGYSSEKVQHFKKREEMHVELKNCLDENSVVLVKGSSMMNMHKTVDYIKNRYLYSIVLDKEMAKNEIVMNQETHKQMALESDSIIFHFGSLTKTFKVKVENKLKFREIRLPQQLTSTISIPDLPYDYYFEGNHLFLGPVIGMLVYNKYIKDPQQQILRFANYKKIKGLIFLFRPEFINIVNQTTIGYYFNPKTQTFIEGVFPYPSVIFNRIPLRETRYEHFKKYIGNNIFNYPYGNTNKLDFWREMSKQPYIKNHLPRTKEYTDVNSVLKALKVADAVYLKPATMAAGNGIHHVKRSDEGYVWSDILGNSFTITTKEELRKALQKNLIQNKTYIVQEEIASYNKERNKIDYRVYLQKDYTQKWRYAGIETKVGQKESIISNSQNRERILPGEEALKEFYELDDEQIQQKIDEITELCIRILKRMENKGDQLGDAAVDLVIDQNQKVWLLEVQLNYAAEIKANRKEDERRVLPFILPTPFEYAKALAGF